MESESQQPPLDLSCDDYYLTLIAAASDEEESNYDNVDDDALMSDSKYAEELQFQDVLISSITSNYDNNHSSEEEDEEKVNSSIGEPSQYLCDICADKKNNDQMFAVPRCSHRYCTECIVKHVSIKLQGAKNQDNMLFFACPAGLDCTGALELDACREIMPNNVVEMWEDAMCESLIDESERFYCPFKDCSGMILNDGDEGTMIRESECPFCHRLFCAQCKVPWHSGFLCEDYSKLNADERGREDLMLHELAKKEKWQRCPRCKFFVEKVDGCLHMACRCGYQFCYQCGETYTSTHGGCSPR